MKCKEVVGRSNESIQHHEEFGPNMQKGLEYHPKAEKVNAVMCHFGTKLCQGLKRNLQRCKLRQLFCTTWMVVGDGKIHALLQG